MDTYWLKALGGGPRIGRLDDDWRAIDSGLFTRHVTFAHNSSLEPGDSLVLYAAGWGAVFATGESESYPYESGDGPWKWRVDISLTEYVPFVHFGVPLQEMNVDGRDLRIAIKRRSHLRISESEFLAAYDALQQRSGNLRERYG